MKAQWLVSIEKKPWALALIASLGTTLLLSSAAALVGPPELLDAAIALGDRRLALGLAGLFVLFLPMFRIAFARRRSAEEDVDATLPARSRAAAKGDPARRDGALSPALRTHLR
jgi:hypothetical protein